MTRRIVRRKARKPATPKTYEVDGHELSQAQYDLYQEKLIQRDQGIVMRAMHQAKRLALSDTFYAEKATTKAKDRIRPLYDKAFEASMTLASIREFNFNSQDAKVLELGNAVIRHCSEELLAVVMELNTINEGIVKQIAPEVVTNG
jgi:hypothetical protein